MVYFVRKPFRVLGELILPGTLITPDRTPHFKRYMNDGKIVGFEPGTPLEDVTRLYFRNKYQVELVIKTEDGEADKAPVAPVKPAEVKVEKPAAKVAAKTTTTASKGLTGTKTTKVVNTTK